VKGKMLLDQVSGVRGKTRRAASSSSSSSRRVKRGLSRNHPSSSSSSSSNKNHDLPPPPPPPLPPTSLSTPTCPSIKAAIPLPSVLNLTLNPMQPKALAWQMVTCAQDGQAASAPPQQQLRSTKRCMLVPPRCSRCYSTSECSRAGMRVRCS
jgi:hypothetical protein